MANRKIQSPPKAPDSFTAEEGKKAVKKVLKRLDSEWTMDRISEYGILVPIKSRRVTGDSLMITSPVKKTIDFSIKHNYVVKVKLEYEPYWTKVRSVSRSSEGQFYIHTSSFTTSADLDCDYRVFEVIEKEIQYGENK